MSTFLPDVFTTTQLQIFCVRQISSEYVFVLWEKNRHTPLVCESSANRGVFTQNIRERDRDKDRQMCVRGRKSVCESEKERVCVRGRKKECV